MNIIPEPKEVIFEGGTIDLSRIKWLFENEIDMRVKAEAYRIADNRSDGIPIHIHTSDSTGEGYTLKISTTDVKIVADGAAGAFYALQTLKQIIKNDETECCTIKDVPDMKYRGFYHDVTRGKIPTVDTLKSLVDLMASLKMNALQLYIEHAFEFNEYEFCREKLGCITKEEIRELEQYCYDRFIELEPSVSLFGHLYHLLSSEKYRHLSELPDYKDTKHYWVERMSHHTINPLLDESFDIIKSIIDQYTESTNSDKFNICCDETFDLGNGVNKGKDKGRLYVDFVKKIISYLKEKGKKVMMWGDIILQHEEYIKEIPEDVVFLNWDYSAEPSETRVKKLYDSGRKQILCPGTSTWNQFGECVDIEEKNILTLAKYAYRYDAIGILNTNWGDYGNICSLSGAYYGLCLGAAVSWNIKVIENKDFRKKASVYLYGNENIVELKAKLMENCDVLGWYYQIYGVEPNYSGNKYEKMMKECEKIAEEIKELDVSDEIIKAELINAAEGCALLAKWCAALVGYKVKSKIKFERWINEYERLWNKLNKRGELDEVLKMFRKSNK